MGKRSKNQLYQENYLKAVQEYKNHLITLGYNHQTYTTRYLRTKEFLAFIETAGIYEFKDIGTAEILNYQEYISHKKNLKTGEQVKPGHVYDQMRNVQMFFEYLLETGRLKRSPASAFKYRYGRQKPERTIFSQQQVQTLIAAAEGPTERLIVLIAYGCGLRVAELAALKEEDIRLSENLLIVQKGKNSKRRLIPFTDTLKAEMQTFMEDPERVKLPDRSLFVNSSGTAMRVFTANKYFKRVIGRTHFGKDYSKQELNQMGIHTLRHSIATHLIENGMKLELVQLFLGHSHIESTEIYTHVSQTQLNEIKR
jgi:integrase/recombinase XerD